MRVMVIGSGGREHALARALAASPRVSEVLVAPGNAGVRGAKLRAVALPDAAGDGSLRQPAQPQALIELAREERIGLTVVGPEAPLSAGLVDAFTAAGLRCFGPTAAAARLESSKA